MMKRTGYRTYITSRSFGGMTIPAPAQNILLRTYAEKNNLEYMLPVNEFMFENCYIQLEAVLEELSTIEGILMCSLFMLPENTEKRNEIYKKLHEKKAKMYFALEDLSITKPGDENFVEELLLISQTLNDCPKSLPQETLPSVKYNTTF